MGKTLVSSFLKLGQYAKFHDPGQHLGWVAPRRADVSCRRVVPITRASIAFSLGAFSSLLGIGGGTIAIIVMTLCGNPRPS